jgi:hypothetical protein
MAAATAPAADRGHSPTEHKRFRGGRHFRTGRALAAAGGLRPRRAGSGRGERAQAREGALAVPYPAAALNTISTNRANVITWTLVHHRQIARMENISA